MYGNRLLVWDAEAETNRKMGHRAGDAVVRRRTDRAPGSGALVWDRQLALPRLLVPTVLVLLLVAPSRALSPLLHPNPHDALLLVLGSTRPYTLFIRPPFITVSPFCGRAEHSDRCHRHPKVRPGWVSDTHLPCAHQHIALIPSESYNHLRTP